MLICLEGHTTCTKCANVLDFCPICTNITLFPPRINHSLVDHLSNLHHEAVCPVIPEESLEFDETCDEIGRGGCAVVYAAKWSGLDVAIKLATITLEGQDQLRKELGLLIKMNNPGILRVFGICFINSKVGIVMERANHSLIVPSGLTRKTLTYAKDICNAVRFLHSKSVVHGDLKPENVLMVQGAVRIADFGTSRIIKSTVDINPQSKQMITPKYAPPEAFDNQVVKEGDVYSLALILYEMLTDSTAFKGLRTYEALYGAKYREEGLLFDHAFPQQLQMVLNRSCVRNPFDRPTIEEILNCLEEVTHYVEQSDLEVINCCSSNQNEQLRLEMQQLGRNYDELQQHNNELRTDLDNSRNEVVQLKQTISNLTAQVTTLKEDKERLSNLVTETEDSVSSSAQEVEQLKNTIVDISSQFQQEISQKTEELNKYQNSSLKMEKTIQQLTEENAKLTNLKTELESVNHEQAQKFDESRKLSAETENKREQHITELEKGNYDLKQNLLEKEEAIGGLEERIEQLQNQLQFHKNEEESLRSQPNEMPQLVNNAELSNQCDQKGGLFIIHWMLCQQPPIAFNPEVIKMLQTPEMSDYLNNFRSIIVQKFFEAATEDQKAELSCLLKKELDTTESSGSVVVSSFEDTRANERKTEFKTPSPVQKSTGRVSQKPIQYGAKSKQSSEEKQPRSPHHHSRKAFVEQSTSPQQQSQNGKPLVKKTEANGIHKPDSSKQDITESLQPQLTSTIVKNEFKTSTPPKPKTTVEPRTNPSVDQQLEERRRRLAAQQSQPTSQSISNLKVKETQKKSVIQQSEDASQKRSHFTQAPTQTKTAAQRFDDAVAQSTIDSDQENQNQLGLDSAHQQHQNPKVQNMINMGFDAKLSQGALQKCHNIVELAVDYLVHMEKLKGFKTQRSSRSGDSTLKSSSWNLEQGKPSQHDPSSDRVPEQSPSPSAHDRSVHHSNPNVMKLFELGFEVKRAERVLAICGNDVERAIQYMAPGGASKTLRSKEAKNPSLSAETSHLSQDSTRSLLHRTRDVVKSQNNESQGSRLSPPNHHSSKSESPQQSPLVESTPTSHPVHSDHKVQKLVEMGFDEKDAEEKLRWFRGDLDLAADCLARSSQRWSSRTTTTRRAEPSTAHLSSKSQSSSYPYRSVRHRSSVTSSPLHGSSAYSEYKVFRDSPSSYSASSVSRHSLSSIDRPDTRRSTNHYSVSSDSIRREKATDVVRSNTNEESPSELHSHRGHNNTNASSQPRSKQKSDAVHSKDSSNAVASRNSNISHNRTKKEEKPEKSTLSISPRVPQSKSSSENSNNNSANSSSCSIM
ncbi:hypothetical protein P9112_014258 [Eukaryota sp. TZLM1-RC]